MNAVYNFERFAPLQVLSYRKYIMNELYNQTGESDLHTSEQFLDIFSSNEQKENYEFLIKVLIE